MNYTPCQERAAKEITNFLLSKDKYMILSAPAGCGKTYLIEQVLGNKRIKNLNTLLNTEIPEGVIFTAMTNKAAELLNGITFDKCFNTFPLKNHKTGKRKRVVRGKRYNYYHMSVIVIDEASMLDSQCLEVLNKSVKDDSKVIFCCDEYQLPPITENISPIFMRQYPKVTMTTPVRQSAQSPLYHTCNTLRNFVIKGELGVIPTNANVRYVSESESMQFLKDISPEDKMLTFTNKIAIGLNHAIRKAKGFSGIVSEGEYLESKGMVMTNKGNKVALHNGSIVQVLSIGDEHDYHFGFDEDGIAVNLKTIPVYTDKGSFYIPKDTRAYTDLLRRLDRTKEYEMMFHVEESIADLRPPWASTVHSSQGSTYNKVWISLPDLNKARRMNSLDTFLRMLYVAVSRAKSEVLLYGQL